MARKSSQVSSNTLSSLRASRGALDGRWRLLSDAIRAQLELGAREIQVQADYADGAWAGFVGSACEYVERNRGRRTSVAPLLDMGHGIKAWVGFQEVWDLDSTDSRYTFHHLSLTVHFGFAADPVKPQVFRCEWPGVRDWRGAGVSFQCAGAGYPHWQFDVAESLRDGWAARAKSAALALKEEDQRGEVVVEEFGEEWIGDFVASTNVLDVYEIVTAATLERLHFASAAPWWQVGTNPWPVHMNQPTDAAGLMRWATESLAYIKQELGRCEFPLSSATP